MCLGMKYQWIGIFKAKGITREFLIICTVSKYISGISEGRVSYTYTHTYIYIYFYVAVRVKFSQICFTTGFDLIPKV